MRLICLRRWRYTRSTAFRLMVTIPHGGGTTTIVPHLYKNLPTQDTAYCLFQVNIKITFSWRDGCYTSAMAKKLNKGGGMHLSALDNHAVYAIHSRV